MPKESDDMVVQTISSDDDEPSDVELTEEDKQSIFCSVIEQYLFGEESKNLGSTYICKQKCTACSENKPNFPTDEESLYKLFVQRGEQIVLSKDDREAINRDLVHNFFEKKWEASIEKIENLPDQSQTLKKSDEDHNIVATHREKEKHECKIDKESEIRNGKQNMKEIRSEDMEIARDDTQIERMWKKGKRGYEKYTTTNNNEQNHECEDDTEFKIQNVKHHMVETKVIDIFESATNDLHTERIHIRGEKENNQNSMCKKRKHENYECGVDTESRIRNYKHRMVENKMIEIIEPDLDYVLQSKRIPNKNKKEYDNNSTPENKKEYNHKCNDGAEPSGFRRHYAVETIGIGELETATDDTRNERILETRTPKNDISYQKQTPLNHTTPRTSLTKEIKNLKLDLKPSGMKPMDNPASKFFIDRDSVDVEMYQDGLKIHDWNPTQSLYELSSKCGWGRPYFTIYRLKNETSIFPSFVCQVEINGETFTPDRGEAQKKNAQHMGSAMVLNYVGFEFEFKTKEPFKIPIPQYNQTKTNSLYSDRLWMDRNNKSDDQYGRPSRYQKCEERVEGSIKQRLGLRKPYGQRSSLNENSYFNTQEYSWRNLEGRKSHESRSPSPGEEFLPKRRGKRTSGRVMH